MRCSILVTLCLVIVSLLDIIPGLIHLLASDGGAESIAGITLQWENSTMLNDEWSTSDYHKETVLFLFGALGLLQIKIGVLTLLGALLLKKKLFLVTVLLLLQTIKLIIDLIGYRHVHSIAPNAFGGYKPYVVFGFLFIAMIASLLKK